MVIATCTPTVNTIHFILFYLFLRNNFYKIPGDNMYIGLRNYIIQLISDHVKCDMEDGGKRSLDHVNLYFICPALMVACDGESSIRNNIVSCVYNTATSYVYSIVNNHHSCIIILYSAAILRKLLAK